MHKNRCIPIGSCKVFSYCLDNTLPLFAWGRNRSSFSFLAEVVFCGISVWSCRKNCIASSPPVRSAAPQYMVRCTVTPMIDDEVIFGTARRLLSHTWGDGRPAHLTIHPSLHSLILRRFPINRPSHKNNSSSTDSESVLRIYLWQLTRTQNNLVATHSYAKTTCYAERMHVHGLRSSKAINRQMDEHA